MIPRRFRAFLRLSSQKLWAGLGLSVRVLFCLAVGLILLSAGMNIYDTRFAMRGPQPIKDDIAIIELSREDAVWLGGLSEYTNRNSIWSLKEIVETSDSFYWHTAVWEKALSLTMANGARAAVVTLFFSDETVRQTTSPAQLQLFQRSGIFWAAKSDTSGHAILPGLANNDGRNAGTLDLRSDPDGKIRHFLGVSYTFPNLAVRVSNFIIGKPHYFSPFLRTGDPINFQGPAGTFKSYRFSDLLKGVIPPEALKNKIVIFSVKDAASHQFQTPVGILTTGELLSNVVYNFIHSRWITNLPFWISALYILLVLAMSLWIIFEYPQSVAFVFLGFMSMAITALSAALFDLYAIWVPVQAPLVTMLVAYVVISSYRLSESEKLSWESERELHYLSEVESLKNNFLSLISHDLKNPLAKIQGITDRLLNVKDASLPDQVKTDLQNINQTSEELRQYITSILQLTRVEARNIKLTKEVCDINSIVDQVLARIHTLADHKNIVMEKKLEPLFSMELDRTLISEVLLNLVENAIKYSDPGGTICISTQEVGEEIRVEVSDTGGGIAQEDMPKVFDKFYRGSSDKTIKVTGTGLGLYLVKYFIELHGGNVFITSTLGVGTTVGFTLPLVQETEENYAEFTRTHR